jgi:hypothetical protein
MSNEPINGHRLLGHVDQVDEISISGWLANVDQPEHIETVFCVGACGSIVQFRACHFRHDVCQWLNRWGKFGFVIPTHSLASLARPFDVRDGAGKILARDITVKSSTRPTQDERAATIFLHIPKTAGTSLRNAMTARLKPWEWLYLYPGLFGISQSEFACLPIAQRGVAKLVVGHVHFGIGRFLARPCRYVTILRKPIARIQSHIEHHARAATQFSKAGRIVPLETVANEGLDEEFDNVMVRYIAGLPSDIVPLGGISEQDLELALFNIQTYFALVTTTEHFSKEKHVFEALLGIAIEEPRYDNVDTQSNQHTNNSRLIDWSRIHEKNKFDQMLYDRVMAPGFRSQYTSISSQPK